MAMNYKEAPLGASKEQLQQYASGIKQMDQLAESLQAQSLLPERFAPEPSRLDPDPEGKIRIVDLTIGRMPTEALLADVAEKVIGGNRVQVSDLARSVIMNPDFSICQEPEEIGLGITKARHLATGIDYPPTQQIYTGAEQKGLDKRHAGEGLLYYVRDHGEEMKIGEVIVAGMIPVADSYGYPYVLYARCDAYGVWINATGPAREWDPDAQFAFSLRK